MNVQYFTEDKNTGERTLHQGVVDRDDCNRPDTTLESLAGLKPAFAEDGSVTAGNASQLSDGASMTLVMSLDKAIELGLKPRAFFRGFTVAGCEPEEMGIGPVYAVPRLLKAKGCRSPISTCGSSTRPSPRSACTAATPWVSITRSTMSTAARSPSATRSA